MPHCWCISLNFRQMKKIIVHLKGFNPILRREEFDHPLHFIISSKKLLLWYSVGIYHVLQNNMFFGRIFIYKVSILFRVKSQLESFHPFTDGDFVGGNYKRGYLQISLIHCKQIICQ